MTITFHRSEFMRQFLLYGRVLSMEEAELYADYELKKNPPTLGSFKEQVCSWLTGPSLSSCCVKSWSLVPQWFVLFFPSDQLVRDPVSTGKQAGGPEGVLWLAAAGYQTFQAYAEERHQEMELDVQGAPAEPCE